MTIKMSWIEISSIHAEFNFAKRHFLTKCSTKAFEKVDVSSCKLLATIYMANGCN